MKKTSLSLAAASVALLLVACGRESNTGSNVTAPGSPETAKTRMLEAGAVALQNKPPIEALNVYLDGFHFYNGRMNQQMEAHHYCANLNEDVTQCVIYDGNVRNAKIMGVEYIITGTLFATLPPEEKALWHSHAYEVRSGSLVAPGIPDAAEKELMKRTILTYGKTWHTWHTDLGQQLPLGFPQLMMGFTADGQADPGMIAARDQRMSIDTAAKRKGREDIAAPAIDPGADAWQKGNVVQIHDPTHAHHPTAATTATAATGTSAATSSPSAAGGSVTAGAARPQGRP